MITGRLFTVGGTEDNPATADERAYHVWLAFSAAMDARLPVTVGFWEVRRDNEGKPVKDEKGNLLYAHTVRTLELFEYIVSKAGDSVFTAMDRFSTRREAHAVFTRVRADRVTDFTVHRTAYLMPNPYLPDGPQQRA